MKQPTQRKNIVGENVWYFRRLRGLSRQELAAAMTVAGLPTTAARLGRMERGLVRVCDREVLALCALLGRTPEELLLPVHEV